MTQKALGRFLWTYDSPYPNPNPNSNPIPNKEKHNSIFKKARELASVSLINQSKMTKKVVGRFLWSWDNPNPNPNTEKRIYFLKSMRISLCLSHELFKHDKKKCWQIS